MVRDKISNIQVGISEGKRPDGQRTILYELIQSEQLRSEDKTGARLEAESLSLVAAGYLSPDSSVRPRKADHDGLLYYSTRSMTVAHTLSVTSYHIISNVNILRRLEGELASALPSSGSHVTWSRLEQLPYLVSSFLASSGTFIVKSCLTCNQSALVQEGLR